MSSIAAEAAGADATDLAQRLFVLFKTAAFYKPGHEAFRRRVVETLGSIELLARDAGALELERRDDDLYLNGRLIRFPLGGAAARLFLVSALGARGIGGLRISAGLEAGQLTRFVDVFLEADPKRGRGLRELREAAVANIEAYAGELEEPRDEGGAAARAFSRAEGTLKEVMTVLRGGGEPDFEPAKAAVERLAARVLEDPASLFELALLRRFDEYTYAHCVNVSVYSLATGARLGLDGPLLSELGFAALFHDLGKARLPLALVDKPGELDECEWDQMRRHPALGAAALLARRRGLESAWARAACVALEHHLKLDGSGYPLLRWPRRPGVFSRICAIADSFDAMVSGRVYARRALSPDEALRRLSAGSGTAYDPLLLSLFLAAVGAAKRGEGAPERSGSCPTA